MVAAHRRKGELQTKVVEYLEAHKGETIGLPSISRAVSEDDKTIQGVISRLVARKLANIEVITRGHLWIYHGFNGHRPVSKSSAPAKGDLLEVVGVAKDGSLLLEFEPGGFYKAIEL